MTMRVLVIIGALLACASAADVCFHGYVMDSYCINLGVLLDNPSKPTLQNPHLHSLHCLVDVPVCYNSVFTMLAENPNAENADPYCVAYALGPAGTATILGEARKHGQRGRCTTCTNVSAAAPSHGFSATITGQGVQALA